MDSAYQPIPTSPGYPTMPASYLAMSGIPGYPYIPQQLGSTGMSQAYSSSSSLHMNQKPLANAVSSDVHSSPQYSVPEVANQRPQSEPYSRKRSRSADVPPVPHDSPMYDNSLLSNMQCSLASPDNYTPQHMSPFQYQPPLIDQIQYYATQQQNDNRPVTAPLLETGANSQYEHHHHHLPDHSPSAKRFKHNEDFSLVPQFSVVGQDGMPDPAPKPKGPKLKFTRDDDALLVKLKETKNLTWKQIADFFPGRSAGTLQVRYCTKLKAKTTLWDDDMVQRLRTAISDYDNDRWRAISAKVGSGFSAKACQIKAEELEVEDLVAGGFIEESEDEQPLHSEA